MKVDTTRDDALGTSDMTELLERLARREVSGQELAAAAQERIAAAVELNAVVIPVDAEPADGPFAGIPSVLKDNEELQGFPTTSGSRAMPKKPAKLSSPIVQQWLALGLNPLAKTTLPEFGLTATTESILFGATRNPWHTDLSTGGSSGGSAALVAAGAVPIGHANDGGGSIRIPAAACGLVGLKPSRGRIIDRPELDQLPINMVTQGVVTRSVRDTAKFFAAAEQLYRNPNLPPMGAVTDPLDRPLRIGFIVSGLRGMPIDSDTEDAVLAAARLCEELGHTLEPIGIPVDDNFGPDFLHYWAMLAGALKNFGHRLYGRNFDSDLTEPFTNGLSDLLKRQIFKTPLSLKRLRSLTNQPLPVYSDYDVVLSPVLGHLPPPIGYLGPDVEFRTHLVRLLRFAGFTAVQNITGEPAISLPLFRSASGLPVGVSFAGPMGSERLLLELSLQLEAAAPWPTTPG